MKRYKVNGESRKSDFHRASPEMALLRLCRITTKIVIKVYTESCVGCGTQYINYVDTYVWPGALAGQL